jgi:hypothetical protein
MGNLVRIALVAAFGLALSLVPARAEETNAWRLYYPRADFSGLAEETRAIPVSGPLGDRIRTVLAVWAKGPRASLAPPLPDGFGLREVFLSRDPVAYVDLAPPKGKVQGLGVNAERLFLQALVSTVVRNFPDIRAVKILVDGAEAETLAGHLDIEGLLTPDAAP